MRLNGIGYSLLNNRTAFQRHFESKRCLGMGGAVKGGKLVLFSGGFFMGKLKCLVAFFVLISCNNFKSSPTNLPARSEIPKDLVITLERTGCYGGANVCPTYELTVNGDGSVVFNGKEVTRIIGEAKDKISEKKLRMLLDEFEKADYFNLEDSYDDHNCPSIGSDFPNANTSIQLNGRKKSVYHYLGCFKKSPEVFPPELYELENQIDEIVGTKRWIVGSQ